MKDVPSPKRLPSNSLETLPVIIPRTCTAGLPSHHGNSAANKKDWSPAHVDEFMSPKGRVNPFSQVTSKFVPLNMSLLCAHQILQKKDKLGHKVLDSG